MLGQTNAKIAGGANVEVLTTGAIIEDTSSYNTDIGTFYKWNYAYGSQYKIDDNNIVHYTSTNPGGGSNQLTIVASFGNDATIKSSVTLDFGQSYQEPQGVYKISKVSPNKDFLFVCHKSAATIFVVPLTKSGDDYSLGTPISLENIGATPTSNVNCFVSNDTFVIGIGANLNVYQYQNGEITFVKTIALSSTPQIMREYNGMLLIGYSNKLDIMDYSTEQILYTENINCYSYLTFYKNFLIYGQYNVLNLTNLTKITMTGGAINTTYPPNRWDDYKEVSDNVLYLCPSSVSYNILEFNVVCLDLNNNTVERNIPLLGTDVKSFGSQTAGTNYFSFLFKNGQLMHQYSYGGSFSTFFSVVYKDIASNIEYNGGTYILNSISS